MNEVIVIVFLLGFITYREYMFYRDKKNLEDKLSLLPEKLQEIALGVVKERNKDLDTFLNKTFTQYLKHIQALEKMTLPKPVTTKMVKDILDRTPPLSPDMEPFENKIETDLPRETVLGPDGRPIDENQIDINDENFPNIPINGNTKVAFEDDLPRNVVE